MTGIDSYDEAYEIVDRLAEYADEDLDLVAYAIKHCTVKVGNIVGFDMQSAMRMIQMELDAKEFG